MRHFVTSKSMKLFYTGIHIVKNLLKNCLREAIDIIKQYEEVCAEASEHQIQQHGLLQYLREAL